MGVVSKVAIGRFKRKDGSFRPLGRVNGPVSSVRMGMAIFFQNAAAIRIWVKMAPYKNRVDQKERSFRFKLRICHCRTWDSNETAAVAAASAPIGNLSIRKLTIGLRRTLNIPLGAFFDFGTWLFWFSQFSGFSIGKFRPYFLTKPTPFQALGSHFGR